MQSIIHNQQNIHPIFTAFDELYRITSDKKFKESLIDPIFDTSFRPLVELFQENGWDGFCRFENKDYKPIKVPNAGKNIIVCFSGGKDSTATALYYLENGYSVTLYHLHGINKMYKDEYISVQKVADQLSIPLIIEDIKIVGWVKPLYFEHPMKNYIIANRAIQWALRNNIYSQIAFGNFSTSSLEDEEFGVCGGDCFEMWDIYNNIIQQIIPGFKVETPLDNMQDTLNTLFLRPELLDNIQSCIIPYNYKVRLQRENSSKYDYKIPANRCGSCWKCAVEYITFCDNNIFEYDEKYYKHCLQVLKNTIKKEKGIELKQLEDVWEHYIFYNISKSKYFNGGK